MKSEIEYQAGKKIIENKNLQIKSLLDLKERLGVKYFAPNEARND